MSEPSSRNAEMTVAAHNGSEDAEQRPAVPQTADSLLDLLQERALNLRQLFWRAHRALNQRIAEKFVERGYVGIRPEHLTVLANINLEETPIAILPARAQMPMEGVRPLAEDLERLGYLQHFGDSKDQSIEVFKFTDAGWELMLTSFNILREIEAEYDAKLQKGDLDQLRRIFATLYG